MCELLLHYGACANSQTHGGATALHRAAYCGHTSITKLLLKHGADPGLTDDDGSTPLHKVKTSMGWGLSILVYEQHIRLKGMLMYNVQAVKLNCMVCYVCLCVFVCIGC